jgi:hypothetical protein
MLEWWEEVARYGFGLFVIVVCLLVVMEEIIAGRSLLRTLERCVYVVIDVVRLRQMFV